MKFTPITEEDIPSVYRLLECGLSRDSTYTAVSLLGWHAAHEGKLYRAEDFMLLSADYNEGETLYFAPLAATRESYVRAIDAYESLGIRTIVGVSPAEAEILRERGYVLTPVRDSWEYLYLTRELVELKGKRFHAKRNFINSFKYDYRFRLYTEEDYAAVNMLLHSWQKRHGESEFFDLANATNFDNSDDYLSEEYALRYSLEHRALCRLEAYVLEAEDRIVGFAAGERLPYCDTGVIYFEKGDIAYKGIYPLLDNLFIKHAFAGLTYVNKQEDMGIEGLRHSKTSYNPVGFLERYKAVKPC